MDVLSEILSAVRLTGAVYFEVNAAHPWISMNPSMKQIGAAMMPKAEHVIPFHVMISGRAWAMPEDQSLLPALIESGDVIMFPQGESHIITSDQGSWAGEPADLDFYYRAAARDKPFTLVGIGGDGERSQFVCGYLGCDKSPFNPLLGSLPRMLIVAARAESGALMRELLRAALLEGEEQRAGTDTVLAKLSELMFVQALREHIDSRPPNEASWLGAVRDRHIGKALQAIHSKPSAVWSLDKLAKEAGMSRSAFAERFSEFVGQPPMQYLTEWRMQLASGLLRDGVSLGEVAERVGYHSEAAFQRAFKKHTGMTPGAWRRKH